MKSIQILMMGKSFCQQGKYTCAELDDLINNQNYIPIASVSEFINANTTTSQTMGANTPWQGSYTTGPDKKYVQIYNLDFSGETTVSGFVGFSGTYDGNEVNLDSITVATNGIFGVTMTGDLLNIRGGTFVVNNEVSTGALFSTLGSGGSLDNIDITVNNTSRGGIFFNDETGAVTVEDCIVRGTVNSDDSAGGFATNLMYATYSKCTSHVDVTGGESYIGGFCARNDGSSVSECYATGDVSGANSTVSGQFYIGGFCGYSDESTESNNYATGDVSDTSNFTYVGGYTGRAAAGTTDIENCYSIGSVETGAGDTGGFCGQKAATATITACYYDSTTSGQSDTGRGEPKTTVEMQQGSIPDTTIYVGWDPNVWDAVDNSSYPILINTP